MMAIWDCTSTWVVCETARGARLFGISWPEPVRIILGRGRALEDNRS